VLKVDHPIGRSVGGLERARTEADRRCLNVEAFTRRHAPGAVDKYRGGRGRLVRRQVESAGEGGGRL